MLDSKRLWKFERKLLDALVRYQQGTSRSNCVRSKVAFTTHSALTTPLSNCPPMETIAARCNVQCCTKLLFALRVAFLRRTKIASSARIASTMASPWLHHGSIHCLHVFPNVMTAFVCVKTVVFGSGILSYLCLLYCLLLLFLYDVVLAQR